MLCMAVGARILHFVCIHSVKTSYFTLLDLQGVLALFKGFGTGINHFLYFNIVMTACFTELAGRACTVQGRRCSDPLLRAESGHLDDAF